MNKQRETDIHKIAERLSKLFSLINYISIILLIVEALAILILEKNSEIAFDFVTKIVGFGKEINGSWREYHVILIVNLTHDIICLFFSIGICSRLSYLFVNTKKNHTPFLKENVKILKNVSIIPIISLVLSASISNEVGIKMAEKYGTICTFTSDNYTFFIIGSVFFYSVSTIVNYGCELQHKQ